MHNLTFKTYRYFGFDLDRDQNIYVAVAYCDSLPILVTKMRVEFFNKDGNAVQGLATISVKTKPYNLFKLGLETKIGDMVRCSEYFKCSERKRFEYRIAMKDGGKLSDYLMYLIYLEMIYDGYSPTHVLGARSTGIATKNSEKKLREVVLPIKRKVTRMASLHAKVKRIKPITKNEFDNIKASSMTTNDKLIEPFAKYHELFSEKECNLVIDTISKRYNLVKAKIGDGIEVEAVRSANRTTLTDYECPIENEVRRRVIEFMKIANENNYKFDINWDIVEDFQFIRYEEGDKYDWHMDIGTGIPSRRKLSCVVQLSDPDSYDGGELVLAGADNPDEIKLQGCAISFPSFQHHKVKEVSKGVRYSIVFWVHGNPFR